MKSTLVKVIQNGVNIVRVPDILEGMEVQDGGRYVVVRCWNKSVEQINALLLRLVAIHNILPLSAVILSIPCDKEGGGTWEALKHVRYPNEFLVIPMEVMGDPKTMYWTRCLNGALAWLYLCGVRTGQVMNLSFDIEVDLESLRCVASQITKATGPIPCATWRMDGDDRVCNLERMTNVVKQLRSHLNGGLEPLSDEVLHDLQREIRNSCAVWNIADVFEMKGFNPDCNGSGGQEDLDLVCRLLLAGMITPSLGQGILHYTDPNVHAVDPAKVEYNQEKWERERGSMMQILDKNRVGATFVPDFVW